MVRTWTELQNPGRDESGKQGSFQEGAPDLVLVTSLEEYTICSCVSLKIFNSHKIHIPAPVCLEPQG